MGKGFSQRVKKISSIVVDVFFFCRVFSKSSLERFVGQILLRILDKSV